MVLLSLFFGLVCMLWGYAQVITKELTGLTPYQATYHAGITTALSSSIAYCFTGQYKFTVEKLLICSFTVGLPSLLSVILIVIGIQMVKKTGILLMFGFINVIWGYLFSVYYYKESQNVFCIVGVVMIIFGVFQTIYSKDSGK